MNFSILTGDVVEVLPTLEANSFDAALCDPPYGLEFMGKEWDAIGRNVAPGGKRRERENAIESRGGKWQPGSAYGVPAKNPRCMDCGRLRFDHAERKCGCASPMFHARASEYGIAIQEWHQAWATALFRVLKPGAMLLAFGGTRTHHRLMCALEDAGFEIRDTLCWLYGSGFPKSHDISKAIDKAAGAERERVGVYTIPADSSAGNAGQPLRDRMRGWEQEIGERTITAPATDLARRWSGYGTALKPAWEPCIVAMKPLDGTFANNAQKWGVAGINVDGGRIAGQKPELRAIESDRRNHPILHTKSATNTGVMSNVGRWPSNVILGHGPACRPHRTHCNDSYRCLEWAAAWAHGMDVECDCACQICSDGKSSSQAWDCSPDCAARQLDQMSGERSGPGGPASKGSGSAWPGGAFQGTIYPGENGGASRFFYTAKVSTAEREGSDHPTMKPIDLTRYLAKLILPPPRETPRRIIVPFAGVGSEMIGAILAGWDEVVGIEKDEKYAAKARERVTGTAPLFLEEAEA